jgi:hypothetical protein
LHIQRLYRVRHRDVAAHRHRLHPGATSRIHPSPCTAANHAKRRITFERVLRDVSNPALADCADRVWREARRALVLRYSGIRRRQLLGRWQRRLRPGLVGHSVHHLPVGHVRGLRLRLHSERRRLRHHGGRPLRHHVRVERCVTPPSRTRLCKTACAFSGLLFSWRTELTKRVFPLLKR